MHANFLTEIILIIIAAFIGGFAARSLRLPPVLGYIASGVVFGALGKNFLQSYTTLVDLSHIGISLLLFTMGFEISLQTFKKLNKKVFVIGLLQVTITMVLLVPVLLLFGFSLPVALFFAYVLSFSSTVVIVKILEEKGLLNNFPGSHVFIYLLIQDLFVVPIIFLMPLIFAKTGISQADIVTFLINGIKPLIIFCILFIFSKLFLSRFLNILFRYPSHELTILATIFVATVSIGILTSMGIPESIAAFLAGVLISEEGKNLGPLSEIRPVRDILLVLFFVTTGMLLQIPFLVSHIGIILLLTAVVLLTKYIVMFLLTMAGNYFPTASVFISSYLANVGEFAIVVGQIAFVSYFITEEEYNLLLSVFMVSILCVPLWVKYAHVFQERLVHATWLSFLFKNHPHRFKTVPLNNMKDHVVICGHGRVGREVGKLLELAEVEYVVIDFNKKEITELSHRQKIALYGDPTDEEVLKAANIKHAKILVIAIPDIVSQKKIISNAREHNKDIIILARSHIEEHRIDLMNLGVKTIIIPEIEAGLKIGHATLEMFGVSDEKNASYLKHVRKTHPQ